MTRFFSLVSLIVAVFLLVNSTGCKVITGEKEDNNEAILILALLYLYSNSTSLNLVANETYVGRANTALSAWQIGLATGLIGTSRSLGNSFSAHNPANWITVSDAGCSAYGVSADTISSCVLGGATIGVCETRMVSSTGAIVDSTAILLKEYQAGADTEAEKQSVFTHEVGHCLGLKHSPSAAIAANLQRIMYPSTAGADTPHSGELTAVADAYSPTVKAPSTGNRDTYYNISNGFAVRHQSFPLFYISGGIGNSFRDQDAESYESFLPPGKTYDEELTTVRHYMQIGGTCFVEVNGEIVDVH